MIYLVNTVATYYTRPFAANPELNGLAIYQFLNTWDRPKFDPKYIFENHALKLEPLAFEVISSNSKQKPSKSDLEKKIYELIRSDKNTYEGLMNNFILESPYYYDQARDLFISGLSSLWENLLNKSLYGFPTFLGTLNNQFGFNSVIVDLLNKYALNSIKLHNKINSRTPGYSFHTLTRNEIECISGEILRIRARVNAFFKHLSQDQKNWIDLVESSYLELGGRCATSQQKYDQCVQLHRDIFECEPPEINFNQVCVSYLGY